MFSIIKMAAICAILSTANAFAEGGDYRWRHHEEYRNGYDKNFGAGSARPIQFYPAQRPYYAHKVIYSNYVQSKPMNDQFALDGRLDREGRW